MCTAEFAALRNNRPEALRVLLHEAFATSTLVERGVRGWGEQGRCCACTRCLAWAGLGLGWAAADPHEASLGSWVWIALPA